MTPRHEIAGFAGTHAGMTESQRRRLESYLTLVSEFHHGALAGADAEAHHIVAQASVPTIIIHPSSDPKQRMTGIPRNQHIIGSTKYVVLKPQPAAEQIRVIAASVRTLFAAPKDFIETSQKDPWPAVNFARKFGKVIYLLWPDGSLTIEGAGASAKPGPRAKL